MSDADDILPTAFARPDVRSFLDHLNSLPAVRAADQTPRQARAVMTESRSVSDVPVGDLAVIRDLDMPGPGGPIRLRLFDRRETRGAGPMVVFYHGGGWVIGDLDIYAPFCAELARQIDLPIVSVDYRLAPEHRFPAAVDDAVAAARWIAASPSGLGLRATGLVLVGESAGGNLSIVSSLALRDAPAAVPVIAQWAIYPASDPIRPYPSFMTFGEGHFLTAESMLWYAGQYRGDHADWRYAPMLRDQAGAPPTLVTTARLDPMRDQGRAYAAACAAAGVDTVLIEAQGIIHGFIALRRALPSAQGDIDRGIAALKLLIEGHR